jgi:serine/threonine protein kinase
MRVPLVAITQDDSLIITSDPELATHKFEIANNAGDTTVPLTGLIDGGAADGKQQTIYLKVSSVAKELGITHEKVKEQSRAGTLFLCDDDMEGEEIVLEPEEELYLINNAERFRDRAAERGQGVDVYRGKQALGTAEKAPASYHATPERFIFRNEKPDPNAEKIEGKYKRCKTAIMMSPEGGRRLVARLVINLSKQRDRVRVIGSTVAEAAIMSEVQDGGCLGHIYGLVHRTNKRGEQILTLYLEYFPDGNLRKAIKTMNDKDKIIAATGIIESYTELWRRGFTHKDLKLENMLWNGKTKKAVVADFGFTSKWNSEDRAPLSGTPMYFSPEKKRVFLHRSAYQEYKEGKRGVVSPTPRWTPEDNFRDDVWALGIALHELLIKDIRPVLETLAMEKECGGEYSLMDAGIQGIRPADQDNPAEQIIRDMLYCRLEGRPTIAEVCDAWKEFEHECLPSDSSSETTARSSYSPLSEQCNGAPQTAPSSAWLAAYSL